nr:transposase [Candidatus Arsenophonus triatominarum]
MYNCGYKLGKLPLSVRYWKRPSCGEEHDRNENPAINLKNSRVSHRHIKFQKWLKAMVNLQVAKTYKFV